MAEKKGPFARLADTWHGQGPSLQAAMEKAWEEAKANGAGAGTYRVLDISFAAENPITEYSVIIGHI